MCRGRHIQSPRTVCNVVGDAACVLGMGFQATHPVVKSQPIGIHDRRGKSLGSGGGSKSFDLCSQAAFNSDSNVASIVIFAFRTRETGQSRLASCANLLNVAWSTPGTRALTAR